MAGWDIDTPLLKYDIYTPDKYPELPESITMTLEDITALADLVSPAGSTFDLPVEMVYLPYIEVWGDTVSAIIHFTIIDGRNEVVIKCMGSDSNIVSGSGTASDYLSFNLTVNTDYTATLDYETTGHYTLSASGTVNTVKVATTAEGNGWVFPIGMNGMDDNYYWSDLYVAPGVILDEIWAEVWSDDDSGWNPEYATYTVTQNDIANNRMEIDVDLELDSGGTGVVKLIIPLSPMGDGTSKIIMDSMSVETSMPGNWEGEGGIGLASVMNSNPYGGDDAPNDGGNEGGSSITGTIIGIIPVFVGIAILMYAVQAIRTKELA